MSVFIVLQSSLHSGIASSVHRLSSCSLSGLKRSHIVTLDTKFESLRTLIPLFVGQNKVPLFLQLFLVQNQALYLEFVEFGCRWRRGSAADEELLSPWCVTISILAILISVVHLFCCFPYSSCWIQVLAACRCNLKRDRATLIRPSFYRTTFQKSSGHSEWTDRAFINLSLSHLLVLELFI